MRNAVRLLSLVFTFAAADRSRADGLVRQLPKDGAWACFYCTEEFDDGVKRERYVTIKSVGREQAGGEPCRWIELKYHRDAARPKDGGAVWKLLIPEKHLGPNGDPLKHVAKSWLKGTDADPEEQPVGPSLPRLYLVLPPALGALKSVPEEQHFDWQKGRLTSKTVLVGSARYTHPAETVRASYRLAVHEGAPFGVAGAKIELESSLGYKGIVRYWLVDMGTDATSELPDAK